MKEFQEAQEVQEAGRVIPFSEAAQRIGRSEVWLRQKIRKGEVPAVKIGRRWFLPEE
ncbi:TPA: DNA-binding protein, partial [Candidatus Micrarchaeota archaeon]|nr:DNA-binding protein [Candidatus Micrarchaeota archaeon]